MKRFRHAVQSLHANYSHSTLGHLKRKTAITMSSTSQSNHKKLKRQDPHYTHTFYWAIPASVVHACNLYWEVPMLQASLVHVPCIGQYQPSFYMYFVLGNTSLHSTCTLYWTILASFLHVLCTGQYWHPFYMHFVLCNIGFLSTRTLYWAMPTLQASLLRVLCVGQCQHCRPPFTCTLYCLVGNANTAGLPSTCTCTTGQFQCSGPP